MTYDGLQIEVYDLTTVFLQEEEKMQQLILRIVIQIKSNRDTIKSGQKHIVQGLLYYQKHDNADELNIINNWTILTYSM